MAWHQDYPTDDTRTPSRNQALLVNRGENGWELSLSAYSRNQDTITAVKQYFFERGIEPTDDYESYDEQFDIETTHLVFPLLGNASADAKTCVDVFRDIIGVNDNEPMKFEVEP